MRIMNNIFVVSVLIGFSNQSFGADTECDEMIKMERDFSQKLPMQVDDVTTVVELAVNCEFRRIKYVKNLSVGASELAAGFLERKQRQHINLHCNKIGLATVGWTVSDSINDKESKWIGTLVTTPQDCKRVGN
jgi:hypothetical protein